ncbi:thiosulfate oxidation carrier protein SoxY [Aquabacterium sp. J223]|uniref:thiosulfate oxidation carrier protein SoxY n=1 Tax=Aquabacterium sp. J223 TaxID=2898431 RepID=UPI0021ADFF31|nr:thiosulfate oxidation carrier protein SoxY [Aquabacterium sp. J223]UUX94287.1 thiosulfate oxidation carrier protein SoxY [Aquabacterium sp. J223]
MSGAFDARSAADAYRALGLGVPVSSRDVLLQAPDIAENGGSVRITFGTALPGVRRVLLLVDRNPAVLSAVFEPSESVEAVFTLQVKMAQSSTVHAVALMQDGRLLAATKDVRVTLGGCGA